MHKAIAFNHISIVQLLLDRGADPDVRGIHVSNIPSYVRDALCGGFHAVYIQTSVHSALVYSMLWCMHVKQLLTVPQTADMAS